METDTFQIDLWNLVDIFLVLLTHDDVGNAGTFGCKYLLLDTTNGEDLAT